MVKLISGATDKKKNASKPKYYNIRKIYETLI